MTHYEANLNLIRDRHPELAEKLKVEPSSEFTIRSSRTNIPTGLFQQRFVHSRFDPLKEADRLVEVESDPAAGPHLFYGFGLGYHVESFLSRHPDASAVVVEPDPSFFLKAMHARNLEAILGNPNLYFFVGCIPEALPGLLDTVEFSRAKVIRLRSLCGKDEDYYRRLDGILRAYGTRKTINLNTLERFGRLWVRNLICNVERLLTAPGVVSLQNMFSGIPSLVLASGPSLDHILPHLQELKERFLLITVDTSLKACLTTGVSPDFVVIVDPQYWNTRHIDRVPPLDSILVSESSAHPRIFRCLELPLLFISSLFPLGQYLESLIGEKGKLGAGGSVATTAWDLARFLGCRPIFVEGLDLGYPKAKTHFKGAFFEERFHTLCSRVQTSEQMSFQYLHQIQSFSVSSNSGGSVTTDQRMIIYKWWFENQLKMHQGLETGNLSPHGVRIEAMPHVGLEKLFDFVPVRDRITPLIREVRSLCESAHGEPEGSSSAESRKTLVNSLEELVVDLERLYGLTERALTETRLLKRRRRTGELKQADIRKVERIDSEILKSASRHMVGFLMQSVIQRVIQDRENTDILNTSEDLYRELGESAFFHINHLKSALERL
jgi:hypothetical protein